MSEFIAVLVVLAFAGLIIIVITLVKDIYCHFVYLRNRCINKRIEILYRMGMVESANILQAPLIKS